MATQTPISERLLQENQNLVLVLPASGQRFDLVFLRTLQTDSFYLDYDEEMPRIDSGESVGFSRLADDEFGGTADSVFEIDEDNPLTIHHYSVGIDVPNVRIYNAYSGTPEHGHRTGVQVNPGDEKGFEHSQYTITEEEVPTTRLEQIKFEGPTISYGFTNVNNNAVQPALTIYGKSYEVVGITDTGTQADIIAGRTPATLVTVGGLQDINPQLPSEFPNDAVLEAVGRPELRAAMSGQSGGVK